MVFNALKIFKIIQHLKDDKNVGENFSYRYRFIKNEIHQNYSICDLDEIQFDSKNKYLILQSLFVKAHYSNFPKSYEISFRNTSLKSEFKVKLPYIIRPCVLKGTFKSFRLKYNKTLWAHALSFTRLYHRQVEP